MWEQTRNGYICKMRLRHTRFFVLWYIKNNTPFVSFHLPLLTCHDQDQPRMIIPYSRKSCFLVSHCLREKWCHGVTGKRHMPIEITRQKNQVTSNWNSSRENFLLKVSHESCTRHFGGEASVVPNPLMTQWRWLVCQSRFGW